jgi:hypothetical protein
MSKDGDRSKTSALHKGTIVLCVAAFLARSEIDGTFAICQPDARARLVQEEIPPDGDIMSGTGIGFGGRTAARVERWLANVSLRKTNIGQIVTAMSLGVGGRVIG